MNNHIFIKILVSRDLWGLSSPVSYSKQDHCQANYDVALLNLQNFPGQRGQHLSAKLWDISSENFPNISLNFMRHNLPLLLLPATTKESLLSHFLWQQKKQALNQEPLACSLSSFSASFLRKNPKLDTSCDLAVQESSNIPRYAKPWTGEFGTPIVLIPECWSTVHHIKPLFPSWTSLQNLLRACAVSSSSFWGRRWIMSASELVRGCTVLILRGTTQPSSANKYPLESWTNQSSSYLSFLLLCLLLFCW